jgi:hypothetical protein
MKAYPPGHIQATKASAQGVMLMILRVKVTTMAGKMAPLNKTRIAANQVVTGLAIGTGIEAKLNHYYKSAKSVLPRYFYPTNENLTSNVYTGRSYFVE